MLVCRENVKTFFFLEECLSGSKKITTHRKVCIFEFVDKIHGFRFVLAVENVKLEVPLLKEKKKVISNTE